MLWRGCGGGRATARAVRSYNLPTPLPACPAACLLQTEAENPLFGSREEAPGAGNPMFATGDGECRSQARKKGTLAAVAGCRSRVFLIRLCWVAAGRRCLQCPESTPPSVPHTHPHPTHPPTPLPTHLNADSPVAGGQPSGGAAGEARGPTEFSNQMFRGAGILDSQVGIWSQPPLIIS